MLLRICIAERARIPSLTSTRTVSWPARARLSATPTPITPAPTTQFGSRSPPARVRPAPQPRAGVLWARRRRAVECVRTGERGRQSQPHVDTPGQELLCPDQPWPAQQTLGDAIGQN